MEIYNLDGKRREYIKPTWLRTRGWERLISLLTLCRSEDDMDRILDIASEYVKLSGDEDLDKININIVMQFGKLTYKVPHQSLFLTF